MIYSHMPPECQIHARKRVDNVSANSGYADMPRLVGRDLRMQIADLIVRTRMTTTVNAFHTDYSIDLYVFTPDEFHRIVQEEAMRISNMINLSRSFK